MGIPVFSHLIKENRSVLKSISENVELKATHLFLDSNSIIYDVIRADVYSMILPLGKSCIREICTNNIMTLVKPSKLTGVVFDGVALLQS